MNRREALSILTSLPAVGSISRADVRPGSVIVVECPGSISQDTAERMKALLRQVWPEPTRIVVLGDGVQLRVLDDKP